MSLKIAIIGARGIPATYGGFETFVEKLSIGLATDGFYVTVVNGKSHPKQSVSGVNMLYSRYDKKSNPVGYYYDSLKLVKDHDLILSCGVGGALFYPFMSALHGKVVTNVDGLEHLRANFSFIKKAYVRLAQRFAVASGLHLVADSPVVAVYWMNILRTPKEKISVIAYGADEVNEVDDSILEKYGLQKNEYFHVVGRMVPENNLHFILQAFRQYTGSKKLVITSEQLSTSYARQITVNSDQVIYTGAVYDKKELMSLRKNAFAYIQGHRVGGTNPSLVEAMAASSVCFCHDNEFNKEVTENKQFYWKNAEELTILLNQNMDEKDWLSKKQQSFQRWQQNYTWSIIISRYAQLFCNLINERK